LTTNQDEYLEQTLILTVVNNRADATPEQLQENRRTIDWLGSNFHPQLNIIWIDLSSPGLELLKKRGRFAYDKDSFCSAE